MRMTTNDRPSDVAAAASSKTNYRGILLRDLICAFTVALFAGCTSSNNDQPALGGSGGVSTPLASGGSSSVPGNTGGSSSVSSGGASSLPGNTGGSSSVSSSNGGSSSLPSNTGGSSSAAGNTGGSSSVAAGSGGSSKTGGSSSVAGGTAGSSSAPRGGSSSVAGNSGGSTSTAGNSGGSSSVPRGGSSSVPGGASGTAGAVGGIGGASGGSSTSGGGTSTGGKAGSSGGSGGASSTGPLAPPVRDTASKVPISSPPAGYAVEGNYPYGPLTSQRIDILYPTGGGPKATQVLPVVVMYHGGAWIHSYTNNYPSGKDHMSTFFDRFLQHGFIVCNAEYRVNDGTADMDYFHGDRTRYVVTGASAGGHLALMVGMTSADAGLGPTSPTDFKIAGIVDGYGPADIEAEINAVAAGWLPASLPNRLAIAKQVNPMTYVRKDVPPLIVVQGANDNTAPVADSRKLVANLTTAGADASMHEVAGAGHGFTTPATAWPDAEKAMFDWLVARGIGK